MTLLLVDAPAQGMWYFTAPCHHFSMGLCTDTVHLWMPDNEEQHIRARHGEGEALREFTFDEYTSAAFILWIAAVHRYECGPM